MSRKYKTDSEGKTSPLPANIYFPAIPTLAQVFGKSTELINVTVTVYLVMQGVCKYSAGSWLLPLLWLGLKF
jgi:hypothetical protein